MVISSKRTIFLGGFNFSKEIYKSEISLNSGISLHGDGERGQLSSSSSSSLTPTVADGFKGLARAAPFQAIHVGAASPEVPRELLDQLAIGGVHSIG